MLEGVTILEKIAKTDMPNWAWIPAFGILLIWTVIGAIAEIKTKKNEAFLALFFTGVLVCIFYLLLIPKNIPTGEYTYQATIDNSVNFKEFDNMYTVISRKGEIYAIEER